MPLDPAAVGPDGEAALRRIREVAAGVASCLEGAAVEAEQACYLPVTGDGLPLIGR